MKKEYINPKIEVVKVETMTFLADSNLEVTDEHTTTFDASQFFDNGDSNESW